MKVAMMFRPIAVLPGAGASLLLLMGLWLPQGSNAAPVCGPPEGRRVLQLQPSQAGLTEQACDLQSLEKLPAREIVATLPPSLGLAGEHRWKGVSLRDLVKQLGGSAQSQIQLTALNDYSVDIPWDDLVRYDPILAYSRDGQRMGIRDKGPLILIYPFGSHPQLQGQDYVNRTIWLVNAVSIR